LLILTQKVYLQLWCARGEDTRQHAAVGINPNVAEGATRPGKNKFRSTGRLHFSLLFF